MKKLYTTLAIAVTCYCSYAQTISSATAPILYNSSTGIISSQSASATQDGHLLSTDWSIFNNKQPALSGTGILSFSGATPSYLLSTGSGDLVKATSPTLVTPTLGVASATSLNITGTGSTGYIELANPNLVTAPSSGVRIFSNFNVFNILNSNGFRAELITGLFTSKRAISFADDDGILMLNPLTTAGDIPYLSANSTTGTNVAKLGIGSTGQILTVSGGIPTWSSNINGSLGIGTTTPAAKLDVTGTIMNGGQVANLDPAAGSISFLENSGKMLMGWNRTAMEGEADFIANQGTGTKGGFAFFNHDNTGHETELIRVVGDGNVGIGLSYPDSKLTVAGTVHAKEVKVDLTNMPDYVFKPTYNLTSLKEIKAYIDQNHHLPGVPSAQQVEKNGLNLGEMNAILLKKVEELTLHLIEKDKQATDQQKEIDELKQQVFALIKSRK